MGVSDDERPTDVQDAVGMDVADEHLAPGASVGDYIIDGELGAGGMGVVYSAAHPVIGKRVAIKVLKPGLSNEPAAVERFIMEARAVNQIGHPNIIDIFAFGALPDGRRYYVMDLLAGETLRKRIKRGPLHVAEAATILDEIASALIAAHDKGIIHRDLKPDNVFMVTVPGRWPEVRILDWGLLKLSSAQSSISAGRYRTLAGSVMGTPVYMSPEQARASESVDTRTDVYSLGIMAYELLSGQVPFRKGSSIDTLLAHQDEPVPSLAARCPALPEELVQLIEAMLAKNADDRPTLHAVRTVIKRLRGSKIPTMTAAGLQMPPGPTVPLSDPAISLTPSMVLTRPRMPAPLPGSGSIPGSLSLDALEPPPLPDQPSVTPYDNLQVGPPQTTLAGVSMPQPQASNPRQPILTTPVPTPVPRASTPDIARPRRSPLIWIVVVALLLVGGGIAVLLSL